VLIEFWNQRGEKVSRILLFPLPLSLPLLNSVSKDGLILDFESIFASLQLQKEKKKENNFHWGKQIQGFRLEIRSHKIRWAGEKRKSL
jgi:hypothetical protein